MQALHSRMTEETGIGIPSNHVAKCKKSQALGMTRLTMDYTTVVQD